jgi:aryl-alcohol dehydrogenase-like predicted oxidoreductase
MMTIDQRPIGTSRLKVAPLALGGNVFGWTADEATSFRILDAFVDAGGNMIDTADVYSAWVPGHKGGESETIIGRWLKTDPAKRQKVVIATKVGYFDGKVVDGQYVPALDPKVIVQSCDASLERLGIDTIDVYYQHKDDPTVPLTDSLKTFDDLAKAGKIKAIGLSNFEPDRFAEACIVARVDGFPAVSAFQPMYNMVERDAYEGALRDVAIKENLGVFPYYSLANGFLTGKYRSKSDLGKSVRGSRAEKYLEGKGLRVLAALDDVAGETGAALASVALAWTAAQPTITAPIASATSMEQAEELIASLRLQLTDDQLDRLTAASA